MVQSKDGGVGEEDEALTDVGADDLDVASDIEALIAAVEAEDGDADDGLVDDDELEGLGAASRSSGDPAAGDVAPDPGDSIMGALELDDADFEELEGEAQPLALYLDIDGTVVEVDRDKFVIGRAAKMCDFAIVDVNISRQHCAIERRGGDYFAIDYGSINGIKIGGRRVDEQRIEDGDVLELAGHRIQIRFAPPGAAAASRAVDDARSAEPDGQPERAALATAPYDAVPEEEFPEEEKTPPRGRRITAVPTQSPAAPVTPAQPMPVSAQSVPAPSTQRPAAQAQPMAAPAQPMAAPAQPMAAPAQPMVSHPAMPQGSTAQTFEERVEMRLEYMSQQIAYLQECVNSLLAGFGQIQDVAAVARVIRERLAGKQGGI